MYIYMLKIFHVLNFYTLWRIWKFFTTKIYQITVLPQSVLLYLCCVHACTYLNVMVRLDSFLLLLLTHNALPSFPFQNNHSTLYFKFGPSLPYTSLFGSFPHHLGMDSHLNNQKPRRIFFAASSHFTTEFCTRTCIHS